MHVSLFVFKLHNSLPSNPPTRATAYYICLRKLIIIENMQYLSLSKSFHIPTTILSTISITALVHCPHLSKSSIEHRLVCPSFFNNSSNNHFTRMRGPQCWGGGQILWHLFIGGFLVNERILFPPKCQ